MKYIIFLRAGDGPVGIEGVQINRVYKVNAKDPTGSLEKLEFWRGEELFAEFYADEVAGWARGDTEGKE